LIMLRLLVNACEDAILAVVTGRAKGAVRDGPEKQRRVPDKQELPWGYAGYWAHRKPLADMPLIGEPNETAAIFTARHADDRMVDRAWRVGAG